MKHNWEYKRLGDICKILNGYAFKSSNYISNGGLRIIRIANVQEGFVCDNAPQFYPLDTIPSLSKYILYEGDLLMSLTGNVGRVGILPKEFLPAALNQRVACLRLDKGLSKKFIFHFLNNKFFIQDAINFSTGVAQLNLSTEWLNNYLVPVPPMEVQKQIVAELDKINETIEDCRELLRILDALAQSLFYEYFGKFYIDNSPHYKSLKEVFDTVTDFVAAGSFASLRENVIYQDSPNYAQLVRTMDIKSNFTKGQFVFVDKHAFDFLWRVNLDKECIILPNIGVNCGEVYHLKPSNLIYDNNVLGPNAILVRSSKYNHLFLSFALKSDDFQKQLSKITSQVAQPKFNKTNLKELKVLIPPLALQEQFAERIEQIEVQKKAVEQTIAELQTLLDSRMDYWFN